MGCCFPFSAPNPPLFLFHGSHQPLALKSSSRFPVLAVIGHCFPFSVLSTAVCASGLLRPLFLPLFPFLGSRRPLFLLLGCFGRSFSCCFPSGLSSAAVSASGLPRPLFRPLFPPLGCFRFWALSASGLFPLLGCFRFWALLENVFGLVGCFRFWAASASGLLPLLGRFRFWAASASNLLPSSAEHGTGSVELAPWWNQFRVPRSWFHGAKSVEPAPLNTELVPRSWFRGAWSWLRGASSMEPGAGSGELDPRTQLRGE